MTLDFKLGDKIAPSANLKDIWTVIEVQPSNYGSVLYTIQQDSSGGRNILPNNLSGWTLILDVSKGGIGGTKMWTINSRLGMKGTVTVVPGQFLKWDIAGKPSFTFGGPDDVPLVGDWNGDGVEGIGAYDPKAGIFYLKNVAGAGNADYGFQYGVKGAVPASWYDTDAKRDGMAVLQGGKWYLDKNLTSGAGEIVASSNEMKCAGAGSVSQCIYAKATSMGMVGAGLALLAGAVYVLFKKKKG